MAWMRSASAGCKVSCTQWRQASIRASRRSFAWSLVGRGVPGEAQRLFVHDEINVFGKTLNEFSRFGKRVSKLGQVSRREHPTPAMSKYICSNLWFNDLY